MNLEFRRARPEDYQRISELLRQIADIHHKGRPDRFKAGARKYSAEAFQSMLTEETKPVFVACHSETGNVLGYAFCLLLVAPADSLRYEKKYLFIDDLCIDETQRGIGIGYHLLKYLKEFARNKGCQSVELNVWECNRDAIRFYEKNGFSTQKRQMEMMLVE